MRPSSRPESTSIRPIVPSYRPGPTGPVRVEVEQRRVGQFQRTDRPGPAQVPAWLSRHFEVVADRQAATNGGESNVDP